MLIPESVTLIGTDVFFGCSTVIRSELSIDEVPAEWSVNWNCGNKVIWDCLNNNIDTDGNEYLFDGNGNLFMLTYGDDELSDEDEAVTLLLYGNAYESNCVIPDNAIFNGISYPVTVIGRYTFYNNNSITGIIMPQNLKIIEEHAFDYCVNLSAITIPESVEIFKQYSFYNCNNLSNMVFEGISQLREIDTFALGFLGISGDFIIPSSVEIIRAEAFYSNDRLRSITIPENVTMIEANAFASTYSVLKVMLEEVEIPAGWDINWNINDFNNNFYNTVIWNSEFNDVGNDGFTYIFSGVDTTFTIKEGAVAFKRYSGSAVNYTIPSVLNYNGTDYDVLSIGQLAFADNSTIETLTVNNKITSIGAYAFYGSNIVNYVFEELSSLDSIGERAFFNCEKLTTITLPSSLTAIGNYAFYYAVNLEEILIPASITTLGEKVFHNCTALYNVVFEEGASIDTLHDLFYECDALTVLNIPSSVTTLTGYLTWYCDNLASVTIPLSVVTVANYIFKNCPNLVISCEAKEKPVGWNDYWNIDNRPVIWDYKNQDTTFYDDNNLYSIVYGENPESSDDDVLTLVNYLNGGTVFNMTEIVRFGISYPVKAIADNAFINNTTISEVSIQAGVVSIGNHAFNGCTGLTSVTFQGNLLTTIGEYAFTGCVNLTSAFNFQSGFSSMGRNAFYDCKKISSINFDPNCAIIEIPDYAFYYCNSADNILTIPINLVTIKSSAFSMCDSISGLNFTAGCVLSNIYDNAFLGCAAIGGALDISDTVNYLSNSAFYGTGITSVTIPAGLEYIRGSCFNNCTSLSMVTFDPGSILRGIDSEAFKGCTSLTAITLPDSINNITLGDSVFSGCTNLSSVNLNNKVEKIFDYVFLDCTSLTSITLPGILNGIGHYAFKGTSLTEIYISDSVEDMGNDVFNGVSGITIYCEITEAQFTSFSTLYTENSIYDIGFNGWNSNFAGVNAVQWGVVM